MFYVAPDAQGVESVYDDGHGMQTAPAYRLDARGLREELPPADARMLTESFVASTRGRPSRWALGDVVARVTKAVGFEPCAPCQKRQAALNQIGDRIAKYWWAE